MTISHKRTFYENISGYDQYQIMRLIRCHQEKNKKEILLFDYDKAFRKFADKVGEERAKQIMERAWRTYEEPTRAKETIVTGADLARAKRKENKKKMKSRR